MNQLNFHTILQCCLLKYNGWSDEQLYSVLDFVDKKYIEVAIKFHDYLINELDIELKGGNHNAT